MFSTGKMMTRNAKLNRCLCLGRAALVGESVLLAEIESGHISAAGRDCFRAKPGGNPAFAVHENIFLLPHIGSATRATRDAMGFRALDNLDAFFAGEEPGDRLV